MSGNRPAGKTVAALALALALLLSGARANRRAVATSGDAGVGARVVVEEAFPGLAFASPVDIASDGDGRMFVVEQSGRIMAVTEQNGAFVAELFLDIRSRVTGAGERGLLGLAFQPQSGANGPFYVDYTTTISGTLTTHISRFEQDAGGVAVESSEIVVLEVVQPGGTHNGGDLSFGPEGYLYIGLGDGGGPADLSNPAQDTGRLLGKILRINVDGGQAGGNYGIPADNPFVGRDGRDEIWSYGLRNPWRFSFDRDTGDLYVADVGRQDWEEVNFEGAGGPGGANYGWPLKEGLACRLPVQGCDDGSLTDPIVSYGHDPGCAVTGGYVYRGARHPEMVGIYLFADYCTGALTGMSQDSNGAWQAEQLGSLGPFVSTFGEDAQGDIYFANRDLGRIYRLAGLQPAGAFLSYLPFAGKQG